MRQVHHWAALLFIAAIVTHLARVFFTGAFRRPRELNWIIGFGLLVIALGEGFTGYSLPDDLLSGTGLRIFYTVALSIPFIGPWLASLAFGGIFPSQAFLSRLFVLHVMLLPGLLIGGISIHLLILWLQKHTQYKRPGATERNVIGLSLWPGQAFRSLGLFFLTVAVVTLLGGFFQINPVWVYGPFVPYTAASPAQPDYYIGWLEGPSAWLRAGRSRCSASRFQSRSFRGSWCPGSSSPSLGHGRSSRRASPATTVSTTCWTGRGRRPGAWQPEWRSEASSWCRCSPAPTTSSAHVSGIPVETLTVIFRVLIFVVPLAAWIATFWLARGRLDGGCSRGALGRHRAAA